MTRVGCDEMKGRTKDPQPEAMGRQVGYLLELEALKSKPDIPLSAYLGLEEEDVGSDKCRRSDSAGGSSIQIAERSSRSAS